jgi:malonyl CoA-acyl carrier protein transacylase
MAEAGARAKKEHGKLGMAAVIGMDFATVEKIFKENSLTGIYPSNDNGPNQVVIAGLASSIDKAKGHLIEGGARRVLPLKVSGAFHTPFMQEATEEFSDFLKGLPFSDPKAKVISSVTAEEVLGSERAKELLGMQLANPVRWTKVMQKMSLIREDMKQTEKNDHIILAEVGPGTVLAGLWKNSGSDALCTPLGRESEIQALKKEI